MAERNEQIANGCCCKHAGEEPSRHLSICPVWRMWAGQRIDELEGQVADSLKAIAEIATAIPPNVLPSPGICRNILAKHNARLIERTRDAIMRECDLGSNDRDIVVRAGDIEDVCKSLRDRALKGEL